MSGSRQSEVFELDEEASDCDGKASGLRSPSTEEEPDTAGPSDRMSLDPFRRAMPQIAVEEDVCSICLDTFTDDDPGNTTVCG